MHDSLPENYDKLAPFREFFSTGVPILMYHKIGARPARVRLKGLYVTPATFVRQLTELAADGFVTCGPSEACSNGVAGPRVTLTFDDGFRNVFENALGPLGDFKKTAIQFLVPDCIGKTNEWDMRDGEAVEPLMDEAQIREWIAAGHTIGSHSLTHARLTRLTVRDAREEIFASKKKLEDLFAVPIEHFCYPYGDWNEGLRELVAEAGYRTACTTDFGINTPATPAMTLRRITVRHPTRTLRSLKAKLLGAS
ncbi:MAG TPA: polysaccharide deacetylase family protein [Verrucomicrobiae bacterium]|jgi:peptidoglycan/xylan/chitin deacetylase (PgdA/CDA1 family)|nr:polysaccharide deacetylase family protein [Verrucomicrobiae bacterium]